MFHVLAIPFYCLKSSFQIYARYTFIGISVMAGGDHDYSEVRTDSEFVGPLWSHMYIGCEIQSLSVVPFKSFPVQFPLMHIQRTEPISFMPCGGLAPNAACWFTINVIYHVLPNDWSFADWHDDLNDGPQLNIVVEWRVFYVFAVHKRLMWKRRDICNPGCLNRRAEL